MANDITARNTKPVGITIDDGTEEVPVYNKLGARVGTFYFNPTDIGFIDRYNEVAEKIPEIFEPLNDIDINQNGEAEDKDEAKMAAIKEATSKLYDLCNYLFGGDLSEAFFAKIHPFSPVDGGKFYCENALAGVGDFIRNRFAGRVKDINNRVHKYTHDYERRSGKHRNGKKRQS